MRVFKALLVFGTGLLLLPGAATAQALVGLVAPLSGPAAILGNQVRAGAEVAAKLASPTPVALQIEDDKCNAEGGAQAAERLVAAKVRFVIGFLCTEAIEAAMPILKAAAIPVITVGVRTDSLTDRKRKTGWPIYRLGPRSDSEREAAARILTRLWADKLFAIVDDGTIYARETAESIRIAAEQAGLKPVFVDTFRPQLDNQIGLVGRLKKSGATHVFAGGDREDIAILTRDAEMLQAGLVVASGEALRAPAGDVALAPGTLMIALPEWQVNDPAIRTLIDQGQVAAEGYVLPSLAAVQIAQKVLAQSDAASGQPSVGLADRDFETAIGTIRFDEKGDLSENPYRLFQYDGSKFVPMPAS